MTTHFSDSAVLFYVENQKTRLEVLIWKLLGVRCLSRSRGEMDAPYIGTLRTYNLKPCFILHLPRTLRESANGWQCVVVVGENCILYAN